MRAPTRETSFSVPFVAGKARPRVTMHGTFTPAATRRAEQAVRAAYELAVTNGGGTVGDHRAPAHVQVAVRIVTLRPLPKSRKRSVGSESDTYKPDADNVSKLVLDALTGVAWVDDAQVTDLSVHKMYRYRGAPESTTVRILWGDDWSGR